MQTKGVAGKANGSAKSQKVTGITTHCNANARTSIGAKWRHFVINKYALESVNRLQFYNFGA